MVASPDRRALTEYVIIALVVLASIAALYFVFHDSFEVIFSNMKLELPK